MQLRPLSDGFGVEADGIDLASPLTDDAFKEIERAFFAGQRQLFRISQDLRGDVARQIFAQRRLGIAPLFRPNGANRSPGCRIGQCPATQPAKRGQAISVDPDPFEIEGGKAKECQLSQHH